MKYEVIEKSGEWLVHMDGMELARFTDQLEALNDVAERLRDSEPCGHSYSLAVRYQARG